MSEGGRSQRSEASKMAALERLLEDLTSDGIPDGYGSFTVASDQVWRGLHHSISQAEQFPRFALRWLSAHPGEPASLHIETAQNEIVFKASDFQAPFALDGSQPPLLDYAGKDLELSRALVCAEKLGSENLTLSVAGTERSWEGNFQSGPAQWALREPRKAKQICLSFQLPKRQAKKSFKQWNKEVVQYFSCCPNLLTWNGKKLNQPYSFQEPVILWRRIMPKDPNQATVAFRPPLNPCLDNFVCSRHENSEIFMALNPTGENSLTLIHAGEKMPISRPGFLPGFEILIATERLNLDMQGNAIVENEAYHQCLNELREEAYDMVVQLYRADPPLDTETLLIHLIAVEGVLLYLLAQHRFVEGYTICSWISETVGAALEYRAPREAYTFFKIASLLSERASQQQTSNRYSGKCKALVKETNPSDSKFAIDAALIDAHVEAKVRRNENDRLDHHTRSQLHLLALRCQRSGDTESAFRLFHVLATSFNYMESENFKVWTQACESARQNNKMKSLTALGRVYHRSLNHGTLKLIRREREQADTLLNMRGEM